MPQRINIVGDLGTTKIASDSYDIDNIYLTEEGWVYRHFKSTDESRWWDEILVAGEVVKADNEPCEATNPPKLGTVAAPTFETGGDDNYDYEYSEHQVTGTPGTYTTKVVATGGGVPTLDDTPTPPAPPATVIGVVTVNGSTNVANGASETYSVDTSNATAGSLTYTWTAGDDGVINGSNTGSTVTVDFTFAAGNATITCVVSSTDPNFDGNDATDSLAVAVAA